MTPDYSVIVPVYNAELYLRQCVDSILAQTHPALELILVDDGSPDGSGAICDEYAARDGRVRVIHKENGGPASAVTAGIKAAAAPYVGFADSDDWVDEGYYGELYDCAVQTGADMVVGQFVRQLPDGSILPSRFVRGGTEVYEGEESARRLTERLIASNWTGTRPFYCNRGDKLCRRELLLQKLAYFDTPLYMGEDFISIFSVLPACRKIVVLDSACRYHYRQQPQSITHTFSDRRIFTVAVVAEALDSIAREAGLDTAVTDACIGSMAFKRVFVIAGEDSISPADRRADVRRLLDMTPPGALRAYAKARKSPTVTLFIALLRAGLIGPCVAAARCGAAIQTGKDKR